MRTLDVLLIVCILLASLHHRGSSAELPWLCDFREIGSWQGLESDPSMTYEGSPTGKWNQSRFPTARTETLPHDWSAFNCIEFDLHSAKATHSSFMFVLTSQNPSTEGDDYYYFRITIDWEGWRHFVIPFNELGRSRLPVGFGKIGGMMFSAEGWGLSPNPEAVLHIANMRLTTREGPWITDDELFAALNLDHPGLEKVKALVETKDLETAKHEFAQYLRQRKRPVWRIDPYARPKHDKRPEGVDTREADLNLVRNVTSVGVRHQFDGEIDWNLNPIDYREWPWQLNRHHGWVALSRAYWDTGEEKYAQEFVRQLMHWIRTCPSPLHTSGNQTYTWRTIESGIRAGQTWMEVYHRFLTSPSFTDEALITMVKSFVEHARQLMKYPTGGNWLAMEANGLMHVGVIFPEFKESAEWRNTASERLYRELDRQVYPDGAQIELSTGYHQVSLSNFRMAWETAHMNDVPMPADYINKMQKMYDYNLYASMPDGYLPGLNDGNRTGIAGSLREALEYFPDRKDYKWIATGGSEGTKPTVGSIALPFAGQLIMRSGWEKDDLYLLMDAGPFGYGHQHEDKLSFVIFAYGKYLLVDPGNYAYNDSKWRRYIISTPSHNTIMVDGKGQARRGKPRESYVVSKPLPNKWITTDDFDYACGTYDEGYGSSNETKVTHTRHIFFVKPEYWIVTDFAVPADGQSHRYESLFHLDVEGAECVQKTKAVRTTNQNSANLTIFPLFESDLTVQIVAGQEDPVVQGWVPAGGFDVRPVPTPIFSKQGAGVCHFLYVFYPTKPTEECPIVEVGPLSVRGNDGASIVGAEIKFNNGRIDYFVQTDGQAGEIRFLDFETDATVVYLSMQDGAVSKAYLGGGTRILRAGKAFPAQIRAIQDLSKTETTHQF